ncbi:MAG TPA: glycoside hydrolase family 92 protein, partial [Bacteroidales bacterium]|nr:glycoside hydrolase family 92 protein [Bacteroidales bacterium]
MGSWLNGKIIYSDSLYAKEAEDAGIFLEFDTRKQRAVQLRSGISYVSIPNASENLETEISGPFGWDFDAVRNNNVNTWNDIFGRVLIKTSDRLEKVRFYNNFYRALCSRNIFSDVNGEWISTDGLTRKFENPDHVALGCDAFWNTFWNLNQFWNLVTPEWSERWVNSQLAMYDANGWLAKGPAGMNYIPVMVAEHEIPLIVSAYQMGAGNFDADKALEAAVKMQTTPAQKVFNGFAGNRDLIPWLRYKYVPYDKGRFSNSMEYSFDDWTVGQLARALGNEELYRKFNERGYWWRNAINPENGYCHMRHSDGTWLKDFDPFLSGANRHYVEANAWQMTFFVPQDVPALVDAIGKDRFNERLQWGFEQSEKWRYNAPNDQYWNYPVVQGNQQSMHFSFLFNWSGKPWLTQKWTRSIIDRYYGTGTANAYLGDEDQGQMSAWFLMASMGLFQTDGGCRVSPVYELASPVFKRIEIDLGNRYGRGEKFIIEAENSSRKNMYIRKAILNGTELESFLIPAAELLKGGSLMLEMGSEPDTTLFR